MLLMRAIAPAGAAFQEDYFKLIHLAMTAHADQDDLLLAQL